jgi:hypothetical protein
LTIDSLLQIFVTLQAELARFKQNTFHSIKNAKRIFLFSCFKTFWICFLPSSISHNVHFRPKEGMHIIPYPNPMRRKNIFLYKKLIFVYDFASGLLIVYRD